MKTLLLIAVVHISGFLEIRSEAVYVGDQNLTVIMNNSDDEFPFLIAGVKFKNGTEAANALKFVCSNWPNANPPTLIYQSNTKFGAKGDDDLDKVIIEISKKKNIRVIFMPGATSVHPLSKIIATDLLKKFADQASAGQPSAKSAENGTTTAEAIQNEPINWVNWVITWINIFHERSPH